MFFDNIKSILKNDLTEQNYNRYIANIEFDIDNSKSESIILRVPNIYIINYIKRYLLDTILNLLEKETGIKSKIEIITKEYEIVKDYSLSISEDLQKNSLTLSPEFSFSNFIVGNSNQFAYNVAKASSENPGILYNPLFIYGGVGLGKTHLLQAVGNALKNKNEIVYVSSEQFMNEFTYSIRNKKNLDNFRRKYRECDVLLIDDIQFLAGKESTQEEFFHTFNELFNNKKQICLTADVQPNKISNITDRLKSRFESGIIVDIQPPELEIKQAIIKKKCEINGINIDINVIDFISTHLDGSIREIEGVLTNMNAMAKMMGDEKITIEVAKHSLNYRENEKKDEITLEDIMELIAKSFNVKPSEITSKKRKKNIVAARRTGIYLARDYTKDSTPVIARYFGLKDHSAVSHSLKAFKKKMEEDREFENLVNELSVKLQSSSIKCE